MDAVASPYTYNDWKVWVSPYNGIPYSIPDSLELTNTPSACTRELQYTVTSEADVFSFEAGITGFMLGLDIDGLSIGVNFEKAKADFAELTSNYSAGLTWMDHSLTLYQLSYGGGSQQLNPALLQVLNALPNKPSPLYTQVLEYWGTHYVSSASFGGYCNFTVMYEQNFMQNKSTKFKQQQIGISIGIMLQQIGLDLDFAFSSISFNSKLDQQFKEHSNMTSLCIGGKPSLASSKQYLLWQVSVGGAPVPVPHTQRLRPLADLVYDPIKHDLLMNATVAYLTGKAW